MTNEYADVLILDNFINSIGFHKEKMMARFKDLEVDPRFDLEKHYYEDIAVYVSDMYETATYELEYIQEKLRAEWMKSRFELNPYKIKIAEVRKIAYEVHQRIDALQEKIEEFLRFEKIEEPEDPEKKKMKEEARKAREAEEAEEAEAEKLRAAETPKEIVKPKEPTKEPEKTKKSKRSSTDPGCRCNII